MLSRDYAGRTISKGSLRTRDLIPKFYQFLSNLPPSDSHSSSEREFLNGLERDYPSIVIAIQHPTSSETADFYDNSEDGDEVLLCLCDELDFIAPDGHYFGVHPGDASSFGFWPIDDTNNGEISLPTDSLEGVLP